MFDFDWQLNALSGEMSLNYIMKSKVSQCHEILSISFFVIKTFTDTRKKTLESIETILTAFNYKVFVISERHPI